MVLTTGCDKTTPSQLMAAATVNIPAIALSVGPMLNGWYKGERTGSGTIVWKARQMLAAGEIDYEQFMELVASSAPSPGYCNTMGTATTMNSLAEALGMTLPGCAAIPAPHQERGQIAYLTGKRIVEMVREDLKPSEDHDARGVRERHRRQLRDRRLDQRADPLQRHRRHIGVTLDNDDWEQIGHDIPLLVDLQPAGRFLGEDYHRAGGVPAVVAELMKAGMIHEHALTVNGRTMGENCAGTLIERPRGHPRPTSSRCKDRPGFLNLKGNLFDSAIMKTSVISEEFRERYLSNPNDPDAFEGRAIVFDGPEDYHARIDDPALDIDEHMRAVHPRRRADRLSRRRRGGEHAAARSLHQEGHHRSCPASATGASPAPRARRRSSTPRRRRRRAAGWPCSRPATACASTCTSARPTS